VTSLTDCPNGDSASNKRSRGAENRPGVCFKCNEAGHYSGGGLNKYKLSRFCLMDIDCPTTGGSNSKGNSTLSCFNCGEAGHFSNGMEMYCCREPSTTHIGYCQLVHRRVTLPQSEHQVPVALENVVRVKVPREGAAANGEEERKKRSVHPVNSNRTGPFISLLTSMYSQCKHTTPSS
jgi:hypothetical protein